VDLPRNNMLRFHHHPTFNNHNNDKGQKSRKC